MHRVLNHADVSDVSGSLIFTSFLERGVADVATCGAGGCGKEAASEAYGFTCLDKQRGPTRGAAWSATKDFKAFFAFSLTLVVEFFEAQLSS